MCSSKPWTSVPSSAGDRISPKLRFAACRTVASVGRKSNVFERRSPTKRLSASVTAPPQHGGLTSSRSLPICKSRREHEIAPLRRLRVASITGGKGGSSCPQNPVPLRLNHSPPPVTHPSASPSSPGTGGESGHPPRRRPESDPPRDQHSAAAPPARRCSPDAQSPLLSSRR